MRNLWKALVCSALLLATQGCAHYSETLKSELSPWIGQHPDRLVEQWGAPNSFYSMESGVKVLSYFSDRQVTRNSGPAYSAWRWGNYSYSETCKINFFTDTTQKKIERYTTTGNDSSCVEVLRDIPKSSS